jgi:hypothetical protein
LLDADENTSAVAPYQSLSAIWSASMNEVKNNGRKRARRSSSSARYTGSPLVDRYALYGDGRPARCPVASRKPW